MRKTAVFSRIRGAGVSIQVLLVGFSLVLIPSRATLAQSAPQGLALEGNIFTAAGIPEESSSVSFTIQIKSPGTESCVLYQETETLNMSNSGGTFAFTIGQGVRPSSGFEATSSLRTTFNNIPTTLNGLTCQTGSTYTPTPGDKRSLVMTFNDGSGSQTVTQAMDTESVPYALFADSIQGLFPVDFIKVNSSPAALTQSNLESVFNNSSSVTALEALIAGSSSLYAKSSASGGVSIPTYAGTPGTPTKGSVWFNTGSNTLNFFDGTATQTVGTSGGSVTSIAAGSGLSGGVITSAGTISMPAVGAAGTYAKVTTDPQGRVSSGSGLAAADIPILDASIITTGTFASGLIPSGTDSTKLPLAGGTMTGAISMGGFKLMNLADPTSLQNAATKNYSDTNVAGKSLASSVAALTNSAGNGFLLSWNSASTSWQAVAPATSGTVTSVGLSLPSIFTVSGSPVTSTGTLTGALASQSANLFLASPDGSAGAPTMRAIASPDLPTVPVVKGGTGTTALTPYGLLIANAAGSSVSSPVCGSGMGYVSNGTSFSCTTIPSAATGFVNGGNSFGASATLGTNDAYSLGLKTNSTTQMTVTSARNVGIGTTVPLAPLEVAYSVGSINPLGAVPQFALLNTSSSMGNWSQMSFNMTDSGSADRIGARIGTQFQSVTAGSVSGDLAFFTRNSGTESEKLRILANGNVGIGTTTPGAPLDVKGAIRMSGATSGFTGFQPATAAGRDLSQ